MMKNFKCIIKKCNQIRNCPMTAEDVDITEQICGKDISHVKRKTTRRNPAMTTKMTIVTPKELRECKKNVAVHIDMMHTNKIRFMIHGIHVTPTVPSQM